MFVLETMRHKMDVRFDIREYYRKDLEKIMMAFRLSDSIRSRMKDISAAGNEVEISVREFYKTKLYPKYHVSAGHIIDSRGNSSSQLDLIISEQSKNPIFYTLEDKSEIMYFETVYAVGEIKRSYYDKEILNKFSKTIERIKTELYREPINPNVLLSSGAKITLNQNITSFKLRNPIFSFLFIVDSSGLNMDKIKEDLSKIEPNSAPNMIVFNDIGIIVNIDSEKFQNGELQINMYPEFAENGEWYFLKWDHPEDILAFQYMLIVQHLNHSLLGSPNLIKYGAEVFDFSLHNFQKI